MDPFAIVVLAALTALVLWVWFLGRSGQRRGGGGGDSDARARAAAEAARGALEAEDLEQLLSATNARRRAKGLPERSAGDAISELGDDPTGRP